jgi:hypothetical protein
MCLAIISEREKRKHSQDLKQCNFKRINLNFEVTWYMVPDHQGQNGHSLKSVTPEDGPKLLLA